ncbi:hypothetical protein CDIK_0152 [Cucumispora dikerogammari]|nr:hypothetical protein CDIK_0152 [Cucumispora dikerogammari]
MSEIQDLIKETTKSKISQPKTEDIFREHVVSEVITNTENINTINEQSNKTLVCKEGKNGVKENKEDLLGEEKNKSKLINEEKNESKLINEEMNESKFNNKEKNESKFNNKEMEKESQCSKPKKQKIKSRNTESQNSKSGSLEKKKNLKLLSGGSSEKKKKRVSFILGDSDSDTLKSESEEDEIDSKKRSAKKAASKKEKTLQKERKPAAKKKDTAVIKKTVASKIKTSAIKTEKENPVAKNEEKPAQKIKEQTSGKKDKKTGNGFSTKEEKEHFIIKKLIELNRPTNINEFSSIITSAIKKPELTELIEGLGKKDFINTKLIQNKTLMFSSKDELVDEETNQATLVQIEEIRDKIAGENESISKLRTTLKSLGNPISTAEIQEKINELLAEIEVLNLKISERSVENVIEADVFAKEKNRLNEVEKEFKKRSKLYKNIKSTLEEGFGKSWKDIAADIGID